MNEGQKLRQARLNAGIKQAKLAEIVGCTPPNIARMESGKHPMRYSTMVKLARALSMPLNDIWTQEEQDAAFKRDYGENFTKPVEDNFEKIRNALEGVLFEYFGLLSIQNKKRLLEYAADLVDVQALQESSPDMSKSKEIERILA